ncbi:THO complex subunit 5 [Mortierella sp. GBA39]|nr:THO complex subunit 5 [Mortierella sp. GBA39]
MTAADNNYPESVSRICGELQNLSTQMLELRRTEPRFPTPAVAAPSEARDDTAMDVDQVKKPAFDFDPTLQKKLHEGVVEGHRNLAILKNLNRQIHQQGRNLRNELTEQKLSVGKVDLGFQNIKYQRKYLMNEIARCHDMETFYQDVPLVTMDEFRQMAPESLTNTTDDHQLMLNRLQFELEERKRYDAEKRRLLAVKVQLTKANKARKAQLNRVETQLEAYIQSSQSLQDLFQEPVEPIRSHHDILNADGAGSASNNGEANGVSKTGGALGIAGGVASPMVSSPAHSQQEAVAADVGLVAPLRVGTTELLKRNDVAQLLPQPLYVLFRQACAFSATFGDEVRAEIQGDIAAAQVEAGVYAAAKQAASLPKNNNQNDMARAGDVAGAFNADSPLLQKDGQAEDEDMREKERRGSESETQNQYERFPLEVIIKIKKDALVSSHTIAHLRFTYLMRLGIVVVAVDSAPGILKLDPSLLLQELFPKDYGEICPNPEAAFLGLTAFDTLVSGDGSVGEQGSDLQMDVKKSGGYAYRWAQELCGLEFLGPLSQGWGPVSGTELENLAVDDMASFSQAVLSGHGNRRAFLSQVVRMIRNRRRAWKSLERQLEDLDRGVIPSLKGRALEFALGMAQPVGNARHKVTISKWQTTDDASSKGSTMYKVQLVMPDPLISSTRSTVTAKVIVVEATVEIALSYVERVPKWELKPGPGFPSTMRTTSSNIGGANGGGEDNESGTMLIDDGGVASNTASPALPKGSQEDEVKDRSPFLDSLMYTVNNELPAALYGAEPGERNMLLSVQLTRIVTDLSTVLETVSY